MRSALITRCTGADFVWKTDSRSVSKPIPHVLEDGEYLLHFT